MSVLPGESDFLVTGYGFTLFNLPEGGDPTFTATAVPLFLWQVNDRLLFETEVELEIEAEDGREETHVELEYANGQYIVNDYLTVGAGKFLSPFGLFSERLHPAWINKLPNAPFVRGHDGLAPFSNIGAFARGAIPAGDQRFNYAVYVSNGPTLVDAETDDEEFGALDFEGISGNLAVGGRVGYLPIPHLELGSSFQLSEADSDNGLDADAFVLGFDASYVLDSRVGLFDFRFEYAFSMVDDVTFDPMGDAGVGPLTLDNDRHGLYAQAAYRPIHSASEILQNFEVVGRYDYMSLPDEVHEGGERERWTLGVNYWLSPSSAVKLSVDTTDFEDEPQRESLQLMFVVGF